MVDQWRVVGFVVGSVMRSVVGSMVDRFWVVNWVNWFMMNWYCWWGSVCGFGVVVTM